MVWYSFPHCSLAPSPSTNPHVMSIDGETAKRSPSCSPLVYCLCLWFASRPVLFSGPGHLLYPAFCHPSVILTFVSLPNLSHVRCVSRSRRSNVGIRRDGLDLDSVLLQESLASAFLVTGWVDTFCFGVISLAVCSFAISLGR